jgi:hypothetical protein
MKGRTRRAKEKFLYSKESPTHDTRRLMIYSHPSKAMFSTVLHDGCRGDKSALDDEYDHI